MDGARDVVEQALEIIARVISRATVKHKRFEGLWVRVQTYEPPYTGALIEAKDSSGSSAMLESEDLFGALYRFSRSGPTDISAIEDLLGHFSKATQKDFDELGDHLTEHITRFESFFNFFKLLGFGNKSPLYHADDRLKELRRNSEESKKILDGAPIERHIKGLSSLARESTVKKIWAEVDNLTQKKFRTTLEKLLGYGDLPPPRNLILRRSPRRRTIVVSPKNIRRQARQEELPKPRPEARVEHEPVKLTPVSYLSDVKTAAEIEEPPQVRIGPKIKTVGVPGPSFEDKVESSDQCSMTEKEEGEETQIQFHIRKKSIYETFERVFKGGKGVVEQSDLIKALCYIGAELMQREGSRLIFSLPPNDQPFMIHRIHGKAPEMSSGYLYSCRKQLETLVKWSMETFVLVPTH